MAKVLDSMLSALAGLLEFVLTWEFGVGILVGAVLLSVGWFLLLRRRYRAAQVTVNIPFGLGNITYAATDQDRRVAWEMYVQLKTRKAALPFDEDSDVITEVYDSLREIFSTAREILSAASPHHGEAQKGVVDLVLRVLNDGIRPYLTRWQASYRRWWDAAIGSPDNQEKTPQEIQRGYPRYKELVADIRRMNDELAKYAEELLAIVHASPRESKEITKLPQATPVQPDQAVESPASEADTGVGKPTDAGPTRDERSE